MTPEEWYKPMPKQLHFEPCICGYNRRRVMVKYDTIFYVCNNCGLISPGADTHEMAKILWNKMIRDKDSEKYYVPIKNRYKFIPQKNLQPLI